MSIYEHLPPTPQSDSKDGYIEMDNNKYLELNGIDSTKTPSQMPVQKTQITTQTVQSTQPTRTVTPSMPSIVRYPAELQSRNIETVRRKEKGDV